MKSILETRLIHWKKQWLSLLFWIIMPAIASVTIIHMTESLQEDAQIPVGLVNEDESKLTEELITSIKDTPLIEIHELNEEEALRQLEKHDLDSVFIIQDDYEKQIRKGNSSQLLSSYQSDISLAYTPVKEVFVSYVHEDTSRSKAVHDIMQLNETYNGVLDIDREEVISMSKEIEKDENLLHTTLNFADQDTADSTSPDQIWDPWALWAVFAILSTLLIFDWIVKERRAPAISRLPFMRWPLKSYLLANSLYYMVLLHIGDILAMALLHVGIGEKMSFHLWVTLLFFRFILTLGAFLLANCFTNLYLFYSVSFIITLLAAIFSGAVFPVEGILSGWEWLTWITPVNAFADGRFHLPWLILLVMATILWYIRKEKPNA